MFERFTEPARRSLFFARYDASVIGSVKFRSAPTRDFLWNVPSKRPAVSGSAPPPPEIAWTFPRQHSSLARSGDVYFMAAVDGPHPGRRTASEDTAYGAFASTSSVGFSTLTEDMAGLRGPLDIELHGEYHNLDALFAALRDQLGLVLTRSPE